MSQLTDEQQRQLVSELVAAVKRFAPEWTSHSSSDPGVTLLELLAWLSDIFYYQLDRASDSKTDLLKHLIAKLSALCPSTCTTSDLTRPRFFNGQLLTAADLQAEQDYSRKMMWRHNRCLFGTGIVTGLRVTLDSSSSTKDEPVITVAPGCAIAPDGQQLSVCEALRCVLRARGPAGYVVLQYFERAIHPIHPVPTPSGPPECSRIEEGVAVAFEEEPLGQGLAIARLKRKPGRWVLDRQFHPPKIGPHP
jgi:hypothetical protein